jgi:putative NADH-flavin reductase
MKMLVLGATGRTGLEIVRQAIDHNHSVTTFVRSPGRRTRLDDGTSAGTHK